MAVTASGHCDQPGAWRFAGYQGLSLRCVQCLNFSHGAVQLWPAMLRARGTKRACILMAVLRWCNFTSTQVCFQYAIVHCFQGCSQLACAWKAAYPKKHT